MTVYAIFLCMAAMHGCQPADPGRSSQAFGSIPGETFTTLAACQRKLLVYNGPHPRKDLFYRCYGRHLDAWAPAQ